MQPTCSRFGTERLLQEIRRNRGRLGRQWPENRLKRHRRRRRIPCTYVFYLFQIGFDILSSQFQQTHYLCPYSTTRQMIVEHSICYAFKSTAKDVLIRIKLMAFHLPL
jgi:hypothetical protein